MKGVDASKKKPPSFGLKSRSLVSMGYGLGDNRGPQVMWDERMIMGCQKMGSAD